MLAEGARILADGKRPRMSDMLLTPGNFLHISDRLSHLRGAAMKLGQMISMDTGDLLPPELTEILARLREDAHRMPPRQLEETLAVEWGKNWRTRFAHFDATPIAAASIGQVHRAQTRDGRDLAIKVQYPGVRDSIDADVDSVATLLRLSGLLPRELDIAPLLVAAKRQLREETDYLREGEQMAIFGRLLASAPEYVVPTLEREFTTGKVLAMSFVEASPIESLIHSPQRTRDAAMRLLIALVLRELFEFGLMQTDPNFANYRYQPETGRLVLLDFGASKSVSADTSAGYLALLREIVCGERDGAREAALAAGFLNQGAITRHRPRIDRMIEVIITKMRGPGALDFGDRGFIEILRDQAMDIVADREAWHVPPTDVLFVQRKISGVALLAARMNATVNILSMCEPYTPLCPGADMRVS